MSLTGAEKAAVQTTMKTVAADMGKSGECFYLELFAKNPSYASLFKSSDPSSAEFKSQAVKTMEKLNELVGALDGGIDAKLKALGEFHRGIKITGAQFSSSEGPLKHMLSTVLGAKYDATAKSGWDKVIKTIIAGTTKEL